MVVLCCCNEKDVEKLSRIQRFLILISQSLEEPHTEDTSKFDLLVPTVVKPRKRHADDVSGSFQMHRFRNLTLSYIQEPEEVGIVREFPFSSSVQRMSVIVKQIHEPTFQYFCKGAPEKILTLCRPETGKCYSQLNSEKFFNILYVSVPEDFYLKLESFTRKGDRVIALAWKDLGTIRFLKIHKLKR